MSRYIAIGRSSWAAAANVDPSVYTKVSADPLKLESISKLTYPQLQEVLRHKDLNKVSRGDVQASVDSLLGGTSTAAVQPDASVEDIEKALTKVSESMKNAIDKLPIELRTPQTLEALKSYIGNLNTGVLTFLDVAFASQEEEEEEDEVPSVSDDDVFLDNVNAAMDPQDTTAEVEEPIPEAPTEPAEPVVRARPRGRYARSTVAA